MSVLLQQQQSAEEGIFKSVSLNYVHDYHIYREWVQWLSSKETCKYTIHCVAIERISCVCRLQIAESCYQVTT